MRSPKMLQSVLLVAFFLCFFQGLHFLARLFVVESGVCNNAGPFGIPLAPHFLGILIGIIVVLVITWWKKRDQQYSFVWLIIVTAGLSNVLERLWYGCVFDYIALPWWPVFNSADVALFVSVVFLVWREYTSSKQETK